MHITYCVVFILCIYSVIARGWDTDDRSNWNQKGNTGTRQNWNQNQKRNADDRPNWNQNQKGTADNRPNWNQNQKGTADNRPNWNQKGNTDSNQWQTGITNNVGGNGPIGGWDDDTSYHPNGAPDSTLAGEEHKARLEDSIPGIPGQSYPNYDTLPRTTFECSQQASPGYYGDVEARCQVFHICQSDGRQNSFLCPVGTLFNQKVLVCDWWYNVNCGDSTLHYGLNRNLYNSDYGARQVKGEITVDMPPQPRVVTPSGVIQTNGQSDHWPNRNYDDQVDNRQTGPAMPDRWRRQGNGNWKGTTGRRMPPARPSLQNGGPNPSKGHSGRRMKKKRGKGNQGNGVSYYRENYARINHNAWTHQRTYDSQNGGGDTPKINYPMPDAPPMDLPVKHLNNIPVDNGIPGDLIPTDRSIQGYQDYNENRDINNNNVEENLKPLISVISSSNFPEDTNSLMGKWDSDMVRNNNNNNQDNMLPPQIDQIAWDDVQHRYDYRWN